MLSAAVIGRVALLVLLTSRQSFAQKFEVASVRPHLQGSGGPTGTDGGPGTRDPEHYQGYGMPLRLYLCVAYATPDCQQQMAGPSWIDDKYDIVANIPPKTTEAQFRQMLENLLIERFKLVLHHETKTLSVYELVIARSGPKLKESRDVIQPSTSADGIPSKLERDAAGFPVLPPGQTGLVASFGPGLLSHWTAQQQPVSRLAEMLSSPNAAGRQVLDKTGLTGKYDFISRTRCACPGRLMIRRRSFSRTHSNSS